LVEQLIRNEKVEGSIPFTGTITKTMHPTINPSAIEGFFVPPFCPDT
jgi:hypothetical protein